MRKVYPTERSPDNIVLEKIKHCEIFKGIGYKWSECYDGCISDVYLLGMRVLKSHSGYSFCCGFTLQVFYEVLEDMDVPQIGVFWQ